MSNNFEFVERGWDAVIQKAAASGHTDLFVICPFIKFQTIKRLFLAGSPKSVRVITRFNLVEMSSGINDVSALQYLLNHGAKIRGLKNLHAKMYVFGDKNAIVTSANLTEAALLRNHEFGFVTTDNLIISRCKEYFDSLWKKGDKELTTELLDSWKARITAAQLSGLRPNTSNGLTDEGSDAGFDSTELPPPPRVVEAPQAWVKFFGEGNRRQERNFSVFDEVDRTGCHWASSYPAKKRPRQVKDGDVIFMARMVKRPNDMVIYGRASAYAHIEGRDEATPEEIARRQFKSKWPVYVRVYGAEFLSGTLENGILLSNLMKTFKANTWHVTQTHAAEGKGNVSPSRACSQQAALRLTEESTHWLNEQLDRAFNQFGKLTPAQMDSLDWPQLRATPSR